LWDNKGYWIGFSGESGRDTKSPRREREKEREREREKREEKNKARRDIGQRNTLTNSQSRLSR